LTAIVARRPSITRSRKSIANYKLRDGQAIGCKVTLRKTRMYEFLDRLVNIALPRVRDFRGLKSQELRRPRQLFARHQGAHHFPEIDYDRIDDVWGKDINGLHHGPHDDEARALLTEFNFPFRAVRATAFRRG